MRIQLRCWQSHWWGIIYAPAVLTHKSHKRLLIMTAARPSWLQIQHFIKGVRQMTCTSNTSTPQHPEVRARLQANSGFKISIGGLTGGSCECEAKNKLISSGEGEFPLLKHPPTTEKTAQWKRGGGFLHSLGTFLPWSTSLFSHSPCADMWTEPPVSPVHYLATCLIS